MRQRGGYTNKILRNALAMVIKVLTLTSYGRKTLRNELCATLIFAQRPHFTPALLLPF